MEFGKVFTTKLILTEGLRYALFWIKTHFTTHATVYNIISTFKMRNLRQIEVEDHKYQTLKFGLCVLSTSHMAGTSIYLLKYTNTSNITKGHNMFTSKSNYLNYLKHEYSIIWLSYFKILVLFISLMCYIDLKHYLSNVVFGLE